MTEGITSVELVAIINDEMRKRGDVCADARVEEVRDITDPDAECNWEVAGIRYSGRPRDPDCERAVAEIAYRLKNQYHLISPD